MYDGTPFLKDHPGGADSILISAGQDASDEFDAIHSSKAKAMLDSYYIGELAPGEESIQGIHPGNVECAFPERKEGQVKFFLSLSKNLKQRVKF